MNRIYVYLLFVISILVKKFCIFMESWKCHGIRRLLKIKAPLDCNTMAPKNKQPLQKGTKAPATDTPSEQPCCSSTPQSGSTAKQWASMGKEALLLLANSLNIHTRGKSLLNIVELLMAHFTSATRIGDSDLPQQHVVTELSSDDAKISNASGEEIPLHKTIPSSKVHKASNKRVLFKRKNTTFDNLKKDLFDFVRTEIRSQVEANQLNHLNLTVPTTSLGHHYTAPSLLSSCSCVRPAGSLDPILDQDGADAVAVPQPTDEAVRIEAPLLSSHIPQAHCSVPSLPAVPKAVLEKIKRLEYVNLELLLPPSLNSSFVPDDEGEYDLNVRTADGVPRLSLSRNVSGRSRIKDFASWCLAWSNYLRCLIYFYPHLATQLVTYQTLVTQFANQYVFSAVCAFDKLHRLQLANDSLQRWDQLDDLLVTQHLRGAPLLTKSYTSSTSTRTSYACFSCGQQGHFATNCPRSSSTGGLGPTFRNASQHLPASSFHQVRFPSTLRVCWRFNRGMSCSNPCPFPHKCPHCSKNHPGHRCSFRPSQPSTQ
ncbi:uncharacterized protein LOC130654361 isoform X2 [Hydractinia symbiolongicarpus]|uniref:uncharacterized protein LOC130654361 isoform X2 n=1 Tax=Hydractinia symbiolongicarpus TaxID=13093 RepID=UPI00254DE9F2|nr:uncharacterized protein LOC130654361 isoform X2 [Hydractinia symbiolongicarpus]